MRITQNMIMNKYTKTLNGSLSKLDDEYSAIATGRGFMYASESPVAAMQALNAQEEQDTVKQYETSESSTDSWVSAVEKNVGKIDTVLSNAHTTLVGVSGKSASDYGNIATQVGDYQGEILQQLNSSFNGQYDFGGAASGLPPFKVGTADEAKKTDQVAGKTDIDATYIANTKDSTDDAITGKLLYLNPKTNQYVPVSAINNTTDTAASNYAYSLNNSSFVRSMPVDLGMGAQLNDDGTAKQGTVIDAATSALDFVCQDVTSAGCKNIYDQLGTTVTDLKAGNTSSVNDSMSITSATQDSETKTTVTIGEKEKMLSFLSDRFDSDYSNLESKISDLSGADTATAITNLMMSSMVYQASLAIGSKIMQPTLADFLS